MEITNSTWAHLERLREESRVLEEKAGLTQKMEAAQNPSFNLEWSSKEYFEYAESWLHSETRSLYFSINDNELRKKLIATKRETDATYQLLLRENVTVAERNVSMATTKTWNQSWLRAGVYGIIVSVICYWILGSTGLVLGIGYVIWFLTDKRDELKYELSRALETLNQERKILIEESNTLEVFSDAEEQNGTEDIFEDESLNLLPYATGKLRK